MTPLTERLLKMREETCFAVIDEKQAAPCIECRSTQYDFTQAKMVCVGLQTIGFYCAFCYRRFFQP